VTSSELLQRGAPVIRERSSSLVLLAACLLCLGVGLLGVWLKQPLRVVDLDVGNEGGFIAEGRTRAFRNFFVFHDPEWWGRRSFRWMEHRGTVTIPAALRMQPRILTITACGCRPDGAPTPVRVLLNTQPVATLEASGAWRSYHLLVPPALEHPEYDVIIDLRAPVWTDGHGRSLGLAVGRLVLRQAAPASLTDPLSTLVVLVGAGSLAWWRRSPWFSLLLVGSWLVGHLAYQPGFLPREVLAMVLVGGLVLLWGADRWVVSRAGFWAGVATWLTLSPRVLGRWVVDDAFISLQYARNLVMGEGLVFNAGERVEGYTNFLWTMVLAGSMALGGDPLLAAATLTLALGFVSVALTALLARRLVPAPWDRVAPALLVLSGPFLLYTTRGSGLETALFAALMLAALVALVSHSWGVAGLLTALTMLTRPDGAILAVAGGGYALLVGWGRKGGGMDRLCPLVSYSTIVVALFVPYFLWRWGYYGYLLPNTFYVKVGGTWAQVLRGLTYVQDAVSRYPLLAVGAGGGLVGGWAGLLAWRTRRTSQRAQPDHHPHPLWPAFLLTGGVVLLFSSYMVVVGGDWMPGARFFVPLLPLCALFGGWGAAGLARWLPQKPVLVVLVLVGVGGMLVLALPRESSYRPGNAVWEQNFLVRGHRETGRWIHQHVPRDMVIAAPAGAISYYAHRQTIDVLGLNDVHIAHLPSDTLGQGRAGHEKRDAAYVLQQRPEIITFKGSSVLWDHPLFATYRPASFDGPEGRAVRLYVRADIPERQIPVGVP